MDPCTLLASIANVVDSQVVEFVAIATLAALAARGLGWVVIDDVTGGRQPPPLA